MNKIETHIGNNIRIIRQIKGMKQSVFAEMMGITQQSVSKMEKKKNLSEEQMAEAARILDTTVKAIKELDDDRIIQNNFLNEQAGYINQKINPVEKVVELYERLIESKDSEIESLKAELEVFRNGSTTLNDNVKSLDRQAK